jgi:hypothetical protein
MLLGSRDFSRTTLRPRHRRMIRAIAESLFSAEIDEAFVTDIDGFMSPASRTLRNGLLLMLELLRWLPLIVIGKAKAFDELPVEDRTRMLAKMDRSRFALFPLMVVAWKTMLTVAYYEDEGRLRAIGYPGDERRRYLEVRP